MERLWRYNSESLLAFASLALLIIVLTVIWTSYQKRMRSAWFAVLVFILVYFLPVYLLNMFRIMKSVGWHWWSQFFRDVMQGDQSAVSGFRFLVTLILMIIALLIPVRAFFGNKPLLPPEGESK